MTELPDTHGNSRCLLLFAREPVAGKVKSRLEPALGQAGTLALYRQLLARQLALVNAYPGVGRQLWVQGGTSHADFQAFNGAILSQIGADIGDSMYLALRQALASHATAVLIGCDCPGIDADYLGQAFSMLGQGSDAVFGPAADGGYVLVGMHRAHRDIFRDIDWGSIGVMDQTRTRLRASGLTWKELPVLHDIDIPGDLAHLAQTPDGNWLL